MKLPPEHPLALDLSFALIRAAAKVMPPDDRAQFESNWQQKCFHRWQFLFHTGLWDWREALKLLGSTAGVVPEAIQRFAAQDTVIAPVSRFLQSPLTCLGGLTVMLLAIAIFSRGLPATRDLFFRRVDHDRSKLVYVWAHNLRTGGGDRPLPADAVEAWRTHCQLISGAAAFRAIHRDIQINGGKAQRTLVITTEPNFFRVMGIQPEARTLPTDKAVVLLSYDAWMQLFHASPRVLASNLTVAGQSYVIRGILPLEFKPLSKQMAIYLVQTHYEEQDAYAAVRAKPGVTEAMLDRDFCNVAQNVTYYFLNGQLRYGFAQSAIWTPARSFAVGALASAVMVLMVFRVKWKSIWPEPEKRKAWAPRSLFFFAKAGLALSCVFTGCLEWSRSTSSILFGNFDPASGPFLLWLYILGTMGVLFWAALDQRGRCRQCLQLLAFPVRMGSPGTMLLDWSGIELCCTEGHGVLHVPHLAPSWAEESDHWITLDESWQGIFGRQKPS